ncbi:hypothetical protein Pcinc_023615 [Petrolisthes cinctipes]|uniref:Uncharacterized protein n=1 Tax=Petrolisthes cinctipes TaxID=88211 RepID=A0AAE1FBG6_PETCI|nr:hypothetical protein Pcinc_023615 [Petrolisthes cinctipes]
MKRSQEPCLVTSSKFKSPGDGDFYDNGLTHPRTDRRQVLHLPHLQCNLSSSQGGYGVEAGGVRVRWVKQGRKKVGDEEGRVERRCKDNKKAVSSRED